MTDGDRTRQEIADAIASALEDGDGTFVSEWVLVVNTIDGDGGSIIDVIAHPVGLLSHTLGALEFGAETIRQAIRESP